MKSSISPLCLTYQNYHQIMLYNINLTKELFFEVFLAKTLAKEKQQDLKRG